MNYQKFARLYSYSRISRYLKASKGNKKKAQQMCSSAYNADNTIAVSSIFLEKCPAYARGCSDDYYSLSFHFVVLILFKIAAIT